MEGCSTDFTYAVQFTFQGRQLSQWKQWYQRSRLVLSNAGLLQEVPWRAIASSQSLICSVLTPPLVSAQRAHLSWDLERKQETKEDLVLVTLGQRDLLDHLRGHPFSSLCSSLIPGSFNSLFLLLTPKLSLPLRERSHCFRFSVLWTSLFSVSVFISQYQFSFFVCVLRFATKSSSYVFFRDVIFIFFV